MRYLFLLILFCTSLNADVIQISSLNEVVIDDALYLLDIDDTLIDSPHMLGSRGWRRYIKAVGRKQGVNFHDHFSLHLAKNYPIASVEPMTAEWVDNLQKAGCIVVGFTARERAIWYDTKVVNVDQLTIEQLEAAGIAFDKERTEEVYSNFSEFTQYYKGIFFIDMDCKGAFLKHILLTTAHPKKIVFVDDNLKHVEAVDRVLTENGIDHAAYWYTAYRDKEAKFNPQIADIQLCFFLEQGEILTDTEAMAILKRNPDMNQPNFKLLLEEIYQAKH